MHVRASLAIAAAAATYVAAQSTAHAGGGFLPPMKLDLGSTALSDGQGHYETGTALLVGVNWASAKPTRTRFDFGLGYVGTYVEKPRSRQLAASKVARPTSQLASAHGAYLEMSMLGPEARHVRTWVTGRGELLESGGNGALGVAVRVSSELWSGVAGGGRSAAAMGVFALGLWAEMGVRELPGDGLARQVSVGISGRLPMVLVAN